MDELQFAKDKMDKNPCMALGFLSIFLKSHPDHPEALQLMGVCKLDLKEDATDTFQKLIEINPTAENRANLAICYSRAGDHQRAIKELHTAIDIKRDPMFLSNLAIQYHNIELYRSAADCLQEAIGISPSAVLWNNLGCVHKTLKNFDYSVYCFQKAISFDPDYVAAHVNLGIGYHLTDNWKEGFKEFEWRFLHYPEMEAYLRVYDIKKKWDGKDSLKGKKVLIHGEQGLGDIIMFSRFCNEFRALGAHVTINVPPCLNSIMNQFYGIAGMDVVVNCDIYDPQCVLPEHDYHISSMSIPHLLDLKEISGKPYLYHKKWRRPEFNVGVIWAGNPDQEDDHERSIPLEIFSDLFSMPGIVFHNLSKDTKVDGIKNYNIQDFGDTQRILASVNLVIGCQTAAIHLAGAMGIPTWTLLAYHPDWRWGDHKVITQWYDSMQLFQQQDEGDWKSVIERVKRSLSLITCLNAS